MKQETSSYDTNAVDLNHYIKMLKYYTGGTVRPEPGKIYG